MLIINWLDLGLRHVGHEGQDNRKSKVRYTES